MSAERNTSSSRGELFNIPASAVTSSTNVGAWGISYGGGASAATLMQASAAIASADRALSAGDPVRAASILQMALGRVGGIMEAKKIAAAVANVAWQNGLADGPPPNDLSGFIEAQMYDPHY